MENLIVFTNYYFAYKAEKMLQGEGIKLQLIPTPPALHNMCGLCILCARLTWNEFWNCYKRRISLIRVCIHMTELLKNVLKCKLHKNDGLYG